jgi:hypothetical protein
MQAVALTPTSTVTERAFHGALAGLLAVVFAASFLGVDRWFPAPASGPQGSVRTVCALRLLTGIPCPTCGMTRSFCAIGRGQWAESFRFNPLGPVFYALVALVMVRSARIALLGRPWLDRTAGRLVRAIPFLALAAAVAWIVRLGMMFATGEAAVAWRASPLGILFGGS